MYDVHVRSLINHIWASSTWRCSRDVARCVSARNDATQLVNHLQLLKTVLGMPPSDVSSFNVMDCVQNGEPCIRTGPATIDEAPLMYVRICGLNPAYIRMVPSSSAGSPISRIQPTIVEMSAESRFRCKLPWISSAPDFASRRSSPSRIPDHCLTTTVLC